MKQKWKNFLKWLRKPSKVRDIIIELYIFLDVLYNTFVLGFRWDELETSGKLAIIIPTGIVVIFYIGIIVMNAIMLGNYRLKEYNVEQCNSERVVYATSDETPED